MMTEFDFRSRSLTGSINEGVHIILVEAAGCLEYSTSAERLLTEASDSPNYRLLQENVLQSLKAMALKFLAQCEKVARAVVARLKEFSAKLQNKVDEYARMVQPRVEAAKKHPGWENLKAEIYPWNPLYLESGISNGIRKLHMNWTTTVIGEALLESLVNHMKSRGENDGYYEDLIEELQYNIDNVEDTAIGECGEAFGISANDLDELLEGVALKAHGNAREVGYTFGRDIDKILATLINSSKLVDSVRSTYEQHARELHDYANSLRSELDEAEELLMSGEVSSSDKAAEAIRLSQQYVIKLTQHYETLMGKANSLCLSLIEQMVADYMRCVNMFVAYKGVTSQR